PPTVIYTLSLHDALPISKRRIINATGLINNEITSIGTSSSLTPNGTPGGLNKWPQKCLLPFTTITINDIRARQAVTAILPVKLADRKSTRLNSSHVKISY